jgi:benzylsuccinate CoA-transferase BbsF subunit
MRSGTPASIGSDLSFCHLKRKEGLHLDKKVFEGIKILDFGWAIAGPLTLKYLADYGATVICIESLTRPDLLRTSAPFKDGKADINKAGYFSYFAANKYSINLDLSQPLAKEIAKKLVGWADIVADSHRPGVLENWNFGYEELTKIKSDIIMVRSSNQGLSGPSSLQPGLGNHINGLGGIVNLTGWPNDEPISLMVAYTDYMVPHFAVSILIGALDYKRKTGKGQLIDLSQFETGLHLISPLLLDYSINGVEAKANGNACEFAAPHGVFRCQGDDRWCTISVFSDKDWKAFCNVMGNPAWTQENEFSSILGRKKNEERLNQLIEQWTSQYEAEKVMLILQSAGISAGVVQNARDLYNDRQLNERECFWKGNHKEIGPFSYLAQPSRLSATPAKLYREAPTMGEHNEYICREILNMSEESFDQCLIEGVFG